MTRQEVFDKVAKHLLKQNERAAEQTVCRLRDRWRRKCALGCLVPDEMYDTSMEQMGPPLWGALRKAGVPESLLRYREVDGGDDCLLYDLQGVHDGYEPGEWRQELTRVARSHGLSSEACQ